MFGITLRGPTGLDGFIATCDEVDLPSPTANKNDPWKFANALKKDEKDHAGHFCHSPPGSRSSYKGTGGDSYVIMTWTPEEHKNASFDKKDPIPQSVMDGVKEGFIVQQG
ncbi:hypothetical protein NLG97_g4901 [Lecanicillium saksenae]|uniref:Uncharacterized protein n=1 Tax=Lecanicillium saksenae TaxID=468837 RepID=A0ACC1QTY1_9HYPO|nr:hypothetical protein NLG97_g4901 [Lecanicillium saksenae]